MEAVRDDEGVIVDFVYVEANEAAVVYNQPLDPIGARLLQHFPGHEGGGLFVAYCGVVESGEPLVLDEFEYRNEIHGTELYYDIRAVKLGDAISLTWRDVSDRHDRVRQISERATHDPLTGLVNRTGILEELERALSTSLRSGRPTGVLLVDLDPLQVRQRLARPWRRRRASWARPPGALPARSTQTTWSARRGGDEFVVVIRGVDETGRCGAAPGQRIVAAFRVAL